MAEGRLAFLGDDVTEEKPAEMPVAVAAVVASSGPLRSCRYGDAPRAVTQSDSQP